MEELSKKCPIPLTEETRTMCQTRFAKLLSEFGTSFELKEGKNKESDKKGERWYYSLVMLIRKLEKDPRVKLLKPLDEESENLREKAFEKAEHARKMAEESTDTKQKSQYGAFEYLLIHLYLQFLQDPVEAPSATHDALECYQAVVFGKSLPSTAAIKNKPKSSNENDVDPICVLFDIILSFLAKPTASLRTVATRVFGAFCDQMNKEALKLFTDVISEGANESILQVEDDDDMNVDEKEDDEEEDKDEDAEEEEEEESDKKKSSKKGKKDESEKNNAKEKKQKKEASEEEEEDEEEEQEEKKKVKKSEKKSEEEEEDDDEDEEDDKDEDQSDDDDEEDEKEEEEEEEEKGKGKKKYVKPWKKRKEDEEEEAGEEEDEEDDSESDEEIYDEELEDVDEDFKKKIKEALGKYALDGENDEKENEESSEEEELNDEEMLQFDVKLAEIFKERKKKSHGKKAEKTQKEVFKFRILELLEMFLKRHPSHPLMLSLVVPLMKGIEIAYGFQQKELAQKITSVYMRVSAKTVVKISESEVEDAHQNLRILMKMFENYSTVKMARLLSSGCTFIVRILSTTQETPENPFGLLRREVFTELYAELIDKTVGKRHSKVRPAPLEEIAKKSPIIAYELVPRLLHFLDFRHIARTYYAILVCRALSAIFVATPAKMMKQKIYPHLKQVNDQMFTNYQVILKGKTVLGFTKKEVRDMVKFHLTVFNQASRGGSMKEIREICGTEGVETTLQNLVADNRFKASPPLKNACKQLASKLGLTNFEFLVPQKIKERRERKAEKKINRETRKAERKRLIEEWIKEHPGKKPPTSKPKKKLSPKAERKAAKKLRKAAKEKQKMELGLGRYAKKRKINPGAAPKTE